MENRIINKPFFVLGCDVVVKYHIRLNEQQLAIPF